MPRPRNRQRNPLILDIHKQRCPIRRERRARQFRRITRVARKSVEMPSRRYAYQKLFPRSVFTKNQISPRCHRQIIRIFKEIAIVRFNEECQRAGLFIFIAGAFVGARRVSPDLPFPLDAAVRAGDIEVGAAKPYPLAARELRRVLAINALFPKIILRRLHVLNIHPCYIQNFAYRERIVCPREEMLSAAFPISGIRAFHITNFQRLQAAAFSELTSLFRNEPIEEPIVSILGLVDNAGPRVYCDSLMVEPSHRLEWDRRC